MEHKQTRTHRHPQTGELLTTSKGRGIHPSPLDGEIILPPKDETVIAEVDNPKDETVIAEVDNPKETEAKKATEKKTAAKKTTAKKTDAKKS